MLNVVGRFDSSVLQERQQCAQDLLNFVGQRSYLVKNKHFKEFFEVCILVLCIIFSYLLPGLIHVDCMISHLIYDIT